METRVKFLQNIQDREKDFKELTKAEESIRRSAQTAVTESESVFGEVVSCLQKTCCRVKELIADQQRTELSHIEGLQEKVQQKIAGMKMKVSELDQFMTTDDHIHFLQNYPSDCEESSSEEFEDLSSISEHPDAFYHDVRMLVSKMQERLIDVTKTTEIEIKSVKGKSSQDGCDADVEIVFERKPTAEQAELAARLMLPHTFFFYEHQPGDLSREDDDEDFEEAVKSLKDANLPRENTGADGEDSDDDDDDDDDDDEDEDEAAHIHEDLLPSVEENEEMLLKERVKLYLWDRCINKWKARGEGDIKILFHPSRKIYRVFMKQDEKVCVNHCITRAIHLKPLNTSAYTVTWTAADSSEGEAVLVLRRFTAKFKTPELAVSFTKTFTDCLSHMSEFTQTLKK